MEERNKKRRLQLVFLIFSDLLHVRLFYTLMGPRLLEGNILLQNSIETSYLFTHFSSIYKQGSFVSSSIDIAHCDYFLLLSLFYPNSLMASSSSSSSSSSSPIRGGFNVFTSFHGPDVRKGFLSHLHYQFASKGITTFNDQEIERGHTIRPELVKAIRNSRVFIVVLSKNYASSSWCLDELVEILKCKEASGQTVMTVFYDVDPSDVRKQRGDFGSSFEKNCQGKTEEEKQKWSQALAYVATIAGEHSLNWANESELVQKIATDVAN